MAAQLFHGAADAFLRRVLVAAQRHADGAEVAMLEKAQHNRRPVAGAQLIDGLVQQGGDPLKLPFGVVLQIVHFSGLPFTILTAAFVSHERGGDVPCAPMQPAAQHDVLGNLPGQPRQIREHRLRDIFGPVGVAVDQPHGRRINEVNVTRHQFAKRLLRAVGGVLRKQCPVIRHLSPVKRHPAANPTKNLWKS